MAFIRQSSALSWQRQSNLDGRHKRYYTNGGDSPMTWTPSLGCHEMPCTKTLSQIRQRCENKNRPDYSRYGGRGIKCLMTIDELQYLWFRDRAYLLNQPSIDRIDNNGHYQLSNCRYVELQENSRRTRLSERIHCPKDHPFSITNTRWVPNRHGRLSRRCWTCHLATARRYRQAHLEQVNERKRRAYRVVHPPRRRGR